MEQALRAITETQAKLAEMVSELRDIAVATGLTNHDPTASSTIETQPSSSSRVSELSLTQAFEQQRTRDRQTATIRRRRATTNLTATRLTHQPSTLSTTATFHETQHHTEINPLPAIQSRRKLSLSEQDFLVPPPPSPPVSSSTGGSIYHDPDDSRHSPTPPAPHFRRPSTPTTTAPGPPSKQLRRHTMTGFTPSPRYPTFDSLPQRDEGQQLHEEEEEVESFNRVKSLIESLLLQASNAVESVPEFGVQDPDLELSDGVVAADDKTEDGPALVSPLRNMDDSISYIDWFTDQEDPESMPSCNDLVWTNQVVLSAIPGLCATLEEEMAVAVRDQGHHAPSFGYTQPRDDSAIRGVQHALGFLFSMLAASAGQGQTPDPNSFTMQRHVSQALVHDAGLDYTVDSFVRNSRSRLRPINFDEEGNETLGDELVLEKTAMEVNELQFKIVAVESGSSGLFVSIPPASPGTSLAKATPASLLSSLVFAAKTDAHTKTTLTLHYLDPQAPAPTKSKKPLLKSLTLDFHSTDKRDETLAALAQLNIACPDIHTPRKPVLFLVNPFGGVKEAKHIFTSTVAPMMQLAGIPFERIDTERMGHAQQFMQTVNISTYSAFIAVSGDGVLHELVNGMMSRRDWRAARAIPVGTIGAGSSNAMNLNLGHYAPAYGVLSIIKATTRPMDLLSVTFHTSQKVIYTHLNLAWAYIADVDIESDQFRSLGMIKVELSALNRLLRLRKYRARIGILPLADAPKPARDHLDATLLDPVFREEEAIESAYGPKRTLHGCKVTDVETFPIQLTPAGDPVSYFTANNCPYISTSLKASRNVALSSGCLEVTYGGKDVSRWGMLSSLLNEIVPKDLGTIGLHSVRARGFRLDPLGWGWGLHEWEEEEEEVGKLETRKGGVLALSGEPFGMESVTVEVHDDILEIFAASWLEEGDV
ncbi:Sphingosine kinase 2 [Podochytrium sp. JEL0797]|nr:Sphingosine kinase 2 [Podochytrium sp. JEL0797]